MKIKKFVCNALQENAYVVSSGDSCVIIDPGFATAETGAFPGEPFFGEHGNDASAAGELSGLYKYLDSEGLTPEAIMSVRRDGPLKADMSRFLTPIDAMLPDFGSIVLPEEEAAKFINGGKISGRVAVISEDNTEPEGSQFSNTYRIYAPDKTFIGTAVRNPVNGVLTADKVFFR